MRGFRLPWAEWEAFAAAVERQGTTRGDVLRAFVRWYTGEAEELPERPPRED